MNNRQSVTAMVLAATIFASGRATAVEKSFYKSPPLFSTAPAETASSQFVYRFGPVGIGIELVQPAFVMKVANVEKGSPAETTGKLKLGQIIETINGRKLADIVNGRQVPLPTQRNDDWILEETPEKAAVPENMPADAARRQAAGQIRKALELADIERRIKEAEATIAELKPVVEKAKADAEKKKARR